MSASIAFAPLDAGHFNAWAAFIERNHNECYCRYWHFSGDKNAWFARMSFSPGENRREAESEIATPSMTGMIAMRGTEVVGWVKLVRLDVNEKLKRLPQHRSLPPQNEATWMIACLLVDEQERHHGLATQLVGEALGLARSIGVQVIRALPRDLQGAEVSDEQLLLGTTAMFLRNGFTRTGGDDAYPILEFVVR
ncbi:MAG: GNAT family N-acetyltransferase [Polyangiaceae bacterium]|nr:GNAT family N-acetyltransferase [Polyangiaceae bacterium]